MYVCVCPIHNTKVEVCWGQKKGVTGVKRTPRTKRRVQKKVIRRQIEAAYKRYIYGGIKNAPFSTLARNFGNDYNINTVLILKDKLSCNNF